MSTVDRVVTPRRRRRRPTGDPALLERHAAALRLLRKGIETDGVLLLSYVVWPTLRDDTSAG